MKEGTMAWNLYNLNENYSKLTRTVLPTTGGLQQQTGLAAKGKCQYVFNINYRRAKDAPGKNALSLASQVTEFLEASDFGPGYLADRDRVLGSFVMDEVVRAITRSHVSICLMSPDYLDETIHRFYRSATFRNSKPVLLLACGVTRCQLVEHWQHFLGYEIIHAPEPLDENRNNWKGKLAQAMKEATTNVPFEPRNTIWEEARLLNRRYIVPSASGTYVREPRGYYQSLRQDDLCVDGPGETEVSPEKQSILEERLSLAREIQYLEELLGEIDHRRTLLKEENAAIVSQRQSLEEDRRLLDEEKEAIGLKRVSLEEDTHMLDEIQQRVSKKETDIEENHASEEMNIEEQKLRVSCEGRALENYREFVSQRQSLEEDRRLLDEEMEAIVLERACLKEDDTHMLDEVQQRVSKKETDIKEKHASEEMNIEEQKLIVSCERRALENYKQFVKEEKKAIQEVKVAINAWFLKLSKVSDHTRQVQLSELAEHMKQFESIGRTFRGNRGWARRKRCESAAF